MILRRLKGWRLLALFVFLAVGCGYSKNDRVPVAGTVSYDGQTVDSGSIAFIPEEAGADRPTATGEIVNGKYKIEAANGPKPGKYKVQVHWKKKTGKQVPTPGDEDVMMDETIENLPEKYHKNTLLTADIEAKANTVNFDLSK
jgi:hypothetical protein